MTMRDWLTLAPVFVAGLLLGALFFGGLWWTVRKGLVSTRPALWFLGSLVLRMIIAVGGFYLVSGGQWQRLLACLAGFVLARLLVTAVTGDLLERDARPSEETGHEP